MAMAGFRPPGIASSFFITQKLQNLARPQMASFFNFAIIKWQA